MIKIVFEINLKNKFNYHLLNRKEDILLDMARILIVDDDTSYLELASTFLLSEGHEVINAVDGEEALKCLEENPDLVLLDILMPGMNGIEVLKRIKSMNVDTKIAFLTQVDKEEVSGEIESEESVIDYLQKDSVKSKNDFLQRVKQNLD